MLDKKSGKYKFYSLGHWSAPHTHKEQCPKPDEHGICAGERLNFLLTFFVRSGALRGNWCIFVRIRFKCIKVFTQLSHTNDDWIQIDNSIGLN